MIAAIAGVLATGCGVIPGTGASRAPIVVMTWAPEGTEATNMPGMPATAQAYARMVDASGGLDGRQLRVLTCNEGDDAGRAEQCADRAVKDHAVAVVGSYSQNGSGFMPSLEAAGISYLGGYGIAPEEFNSPVSYPVNGGAPALLAGDGHQLSGVCDKTVLVRPDSDTGDQYPGYLDAGLAFHHRPPARDISVPDNATQYATAARSALGDDAAGRCVTAVLGDRTGTFFDSFRRQLPPGSPVRTSSVLGSVNQSLLDSTGGADSPLEGAYATSWYPPADDRRWDPLRRAISRYAFGDDRIDVADPGCETTWIAYTVLSAVVRSLGDGPVTAETVHRALDRAHGVSTGGLTPPLGWRFPDMLGIPDYPRMVNADVTYQIVRNGKLTAMGSGGFVDLRGTMEHVDATNP